MNYSRISHQALSLAAINGFIVVMLGAFGAHLLEQKITADLLDTFQTGIRYHMFHVPALLAVALVATLKPEPGLLKTSLWAFAIGILLFSGSLYVLALTGMTWLGMVTPVGGVAFLLGWVLLFVEVKSFGRE